MKHKATFFRIETMLYVFSLMDVYGEIGQIAPRAGQDMLPV